MVNNVNNNSVNEAKASAYQSQNQKLEQAKQDSVSNTTQQASSAKSAEKDSVALTPQAKQLKDLQKKITESESFDRKKIDDIKKAIASGDYKINYDKLAEKLSAFEFDL